MRTCVGCRRQAAQDELYRVVLLEGALVVSRTAPGRGAWLHRAWAPCLAEAGRARAFSRALRTPIDASLVDQLAVQLSAGGGKG